MFSLANLLDLLRNVAIIAVVVVWFWRYSPWRKRGPSQPDAPATSDEVDLVWAQMEEVADGYHQTRIRREHLLWAILSTPGAQLDAVLGRVPVDRLQARVRVAAVISGFPRPFLWRVYHQRLWLSLEVRQTLSQARHEAVQARAGQMAPVHVLLALVDPDPAPVGEEAARMQALMMELGLTRAALTRAEA